MSVRRDDSGARRPGAPDAHVPAAVTASRSGAAAGTPAPGAVPSGPCPVCGAATEWEPYSIREMMFGSREAFDYGRCTTCGSIVIARVPPDLGRHYPDAYYSNAPRETIEQDGFLRWLGVRQVVARELFGSARIRAAVAARLGARVPPELREVRPFVAAAGLRSLDDPVLDVGSGATPARLAILRKVGFGALRGIEPFIPDDTTYRGVRIQKGYLDDVRKRWAVVMFNHSLEHVPDPLATLRAARERLRPNGRCLVRLPVADGVLWRRFGVDWVELDAPRHLVLPSLRGFTTLAARAGFAIRSVTWESGDWELIASEQYARDIGMFEPGSWFADPAGSSIDGGRAASYKDEARRMNAAGDAGRAAFWLETRSP